MLGDNRTTKMTMDRLEALSMSLNERYDRLNAKTKAKTTAATSLSVKQTKTVSNDDRSRSNSPKDNNIDIASMRLMSCQQLFESIKLQNVLVIDCRSAEDFKSSHLQYNLTLSIPEEIIQAG